VNLFEYRHDRQLGGSLPHMRRPETQRNWDAVIKPFDGLALTDSELGWFREHSGRQAPLPGGYSELVAIVGRQAGKDDLCADAGNARAIQTLLTKEPVDGLYISFIAQDHRSSVRTLFHRVCRPWLQIPMLNKHVAAQTADSLTLDNGLTLAAYPCRPQALRGLRNLCAAMNETAHYRNSQGYPVDVELRRAVLPTLSTTGGKLLIVSSPYLQTDLLGDLYRRHWGRDESPTLVIQATAPELNPTLPPDYLERMEQDDPEAFRSEVLGEFRTGTSTFLDAEALDACVADWRELPPGAASSWVAFADFSSGKSDASVVALGFRDGERAVCGVLRAWPAPHNPENVISEASTLLKSYGVHNVVADRYSIGFVDQALRRNGIYFQPSELDASRLYLELLPRILSGTVTAPNDPALLRELRSLERRRGFAGKDKVSHRSRGPDDRANALAGCIWLASAAPPITADWIAANDGFWHRSSWREYN